VSTSNYCCSCDVRQAVLVMRVSRCDRCIRSDHVSATRRRVVLPPPPSPSSPPLVPPVYRVSCVLRSETLVRVAIFTPVLLAETSWCSVARRAFHRLATFCPPYGRASFERTASSSSSSSLCCRVCGSCFPPFRRRRRRCHWTCSARVDCYCHRS